MWATHRKHTLYADYDHKAFSVKNKNLLLLGENIKCWESQMHCSPDTHQHSYLMKTDIGIHPAFAFRMKKNQNTATQENIYYMTGRPFYQVNADWLYLTCSTSESQTANLMSNCSRWKFKTQSPDKCATLYDRNDSLIYWAVMCTCSPLLDVFVDRFSSNQPPILTQKILQSVLILFSICTSRWRSGLSVSLNYLIISSVIHDS